MKKLILLFSLVLFFFTILINTPSAEARTTRVKGYYKPSTGTYVAPHYKTSPNSSKWDNYSTKGNSNPFTGKKGSTSPYRSYKRY